MTWGPQPEGGCSGGYKCSSGCCHDNFPSHIVFVVLAPLWLSTCVSLCVYIFFTEVWVYTQRDTQVDNHNGAKTTNQGYSGDRDCFKPLFFLQFQLNHYLFFLFQTTTNPKRINAYSNMIPSCLLAFSILNYWAIQSMKQWLFCL